MRKLRLRSPRHATAMSGVREGSREAHPMKRQLFLALSAASLVLCVATAIVWLETLHDSDGFTVGSNQIHISSYRGWLYIQRIVVEAAYPANLPNNPSARLAFYITHTTPRHALAPLAAHTSPPSCPHAASSQQNASRDHDRIRAQVFAQTAATISAPRPIAASECGAIPGNKLKPLPK